jgi:quercetin dioxygenase-like cupin family protein
MRRNTIIAAAVAATLLLSAFSGWVLASAPSGVTPTVLARGTYPAFKVASQQGPGMFKAEAKAPIDMVVRRHEYAAGGSTGWHAHPYPVFINVISGQLTFYEYDDPTCTPIVVSAGQGYVDSGHGHIARNETDQPAVDISVIMAPVGGAFRTELSAPGPYCCF